MQPLEPKLVKSVSIYALLALLGYMMADLTIIGTRDRLLPLKPPPARASQSRPMPLTSRGAYNVIAANDIFNSDFKIPDALGIKPEDGTGPGGKGAPDAPPVPSTLPIQLLGTIVHANPARSVATISLKNKNDQIAVRVDGEIENMAKVTKIERQKITFRNAASQRLEYIEMKDDSKFLLNTSGPQVKQAGPVMQKSETEFELKKADVEKLTANLPELLQQARAVPRMGPSGQIECFNLAEIAPNSIYEKLGLKRGDCIKGVNGEKIDSPAKAMDMYNALRSVSNSIQMSIERGGRDENFNYSITQ